MAKINLNSNLNKLFTDSYSSVKGNEMAQLGEYAAAIELFSEAVKLDPRDFRCVSFTYTEQKISFCVNDVITQSFFEEKI